ncbi:hypothetical protein [Bowmanella sp. JS7-9]|uniref:Uncharacterized protein n=1 Tax=Pseudobowmanella zhangzhouensis TaxID=1537679 RepID=A0ABW1XKY1_9ALTE|nr:hypothetical protein [Bowmanella sp. JS7-9]TBX27297.1 hypothetical protein TK45_00655 [Bowmanella sp. JS7-9]
MEKRQSSQSDMTQDSSNTDPDHKALLAQSTMRVLPNYGGNLFPESLPSKISGAYYNVKYDLMFWLIERHPAVARCFGWTDSIAD